MICSTSITFLNTAYALQSLFNLKRKSWQLKNGYAYLKSFTCFIDEDSSGTYISFPKSSTPVSLFHFISDIFSIFQSLQLCQ